MPNSMTLDDVDATPRPATAVSSMSPSMTPSITSSMTPSAHLAIDTTSADSSAPHKSRMIITEMILNNFKSYAGRQKIGPFHKSFTAVVGPNGSGKSNVIDALLFVFGYRANKMRQGRLSELIHNSAFAEKSNSCSVEVHFADIIDEPGSEIYTIVPNSQLVVSRIAFRNNSSKYTINDRTSNFTEVTTLLKGRGIDLDHKRFLILQGEVESIAQMKPKAANEHDDGLLEYLEDIIGTSKYKQSIADAALKIEGLNDERSGKLVRLKIVEDEKEALESKKEAAEAYLNSLNKLVRLQNQLYQIFLSDCDANIQEATSTANEMSEQLNSLEMEQSVATQDVKQLEQQYKQLLKDGEGDNKIADGITSEIAKINREMIRLQEQAKHLKSKKSKVQKSHDGDKSALLSAERGLADATSEIETDNAALDELKESLYELESKMQSLMDGVKGKIGNLSSSLGDKQYELDSLKEQLGNLRSNARIATSELEMLQDKATSAGHEAVAVQTQLEKLTEEHTTKQEAHAELQTERNTSLKELEAARRQVQQSTAENQNLKQSISQLRMTKEEARSSKVSEDARSSVLSSLKSLKASGRVPGIHDRLGNLGIIDDKYDTAVTTAASALNHIVVEDIDSGSQCVEYLKKNNLGRAHFLCLDKIPNRPISTIKTPENVPRLFDLIKPKDTKFAQAFYFALQDTLVADDLQQANRIAYGKQRWRVVTLKGELIDKSGTMSGGGSTPLRGGMSSKFAPQVASPKAMKALEGQLVDAEARLRMNEADSESLLQAVDDLDKRSRQLDVELQKSDLDLRTLNKQITEMKNRIAELKSSKKMDKTDAKRIAELTKQVQNNEREEAKVNDQVKAVAAELAAIQEKILVAGGSPLRNQKSKVDACKERIEALTERLERNEIRRAKSEKDLLRLQKASENNDMDTIERELQTAMQAIEDKTEMLDDLKRQLDDHESNRDGNKEEVKRVKDLFDAQSKVVNESRKKIVAVKNELEDVNKVIIDNKRKSKHWQEKLSGLELSETEACRDTELQKFSAVELAEMERDDLKAKIAVLEEELANSKPNLSVLDEYRRRHEEYLVKAKELEEITTARDETKAGMDALRKKRLDEFTIGFSQISLKLKEMYQMITLGGNAELELVDSLDPFSEGITFSVMPPKKSWKNISNLSGGEKTLSSLALVFALHHFKPTPLYVMDEIDAALDFRNVSIIANYILDRTKDAQFIIISLRNNMFELSQRLVGIYKTTDQTKSITVENTKRDSAVVV